MKFIVLLVIIFLTSIGNLVYTKKLANLPEVDKPVYMLVNNGQLFITDETVKVHLYSMKNFKYLKQISQYGEGPGECYSVPQLTVGSNYIFLYSLGKCMFFSRDGNYLREFKIPRKGTTAAPVGENFVADKRILDKKNIPYNEMSIYAYTNDKGLEYKKLIYYYEQTNIGRKGSKVAYIPDKDYCGFIVYDNKIFIGDTTRGLFAEIYDSNGNKISRVKLDIEKTKVSEQYKKELLGKLKNSSSWAMFNSIYYIDFPEYFPSFFRFLVANGKIYFITYNKKYDKREVVSADWNGNLLKRTYVPWIDHGMFVNFSIENDTFYYLVENEETEEWELHMMELSLNQGVK